MFTFLYSLSTAWGASTASYDSKSGSFTDGTGFEGFDISADGATLVKSVSSGNIFSYSLSTAWDISTGSYVGTESFATYGYGLAFNHDGSYIYASGGTAASNAPLGSKEYTAAVDENLIVQQVAGINLPDTPVDGSIIRVRRFYGGAGDPTVKTQGSDTFDDATTTLTLDTDKETAECIYNGLTNEWEVY